MPKCKVIGVSGRVSGTSKKTGRDYDFQNLHLSYADSQVFGEAVMTQAVDTSKVPQGLLPGMDVYVEFNQRGRVDAVQIGRASCRERV